MNAREGIFCGIGILGLLGTAFFASQASRANDRIRSLEKQVQDLSPLRAKADQAGKDLAAARAEGARLELEAVKAVEERKAAEADRQDVQARLAGLEAGGKPEPSALPAAARKKGGLRKMVKMMGSPAMKEQMRKHTTQTVEENYAEFFQESGLDPDLQAKVVQALVDRKLAQQETAMMLFDENLSAEEILRRQEETRARQASALTSLLGGQYGSLEAYDKALPDRLQTKAVDQDLKALNLQPYQQDQVRAIVLEEQKAIRKDREGSISMPEGRVTAESIRKSREMLDGSPASEAQVEAMVKSMTESLERTLARVQPLLSPDQYEPFKKQQEAKAQMMEMSIRMTVTIGE